MEHLRTDRPKSQMSDEERVRDSSRKLYRKAKGEADFRFYVLYDKVRLPYFLREAYRRCRVKGGSPGVDGVSFDQIEAEGVEKFLAGIAEELLNDSYKPQAVKRVYVPKANGKQRPPGIPVIKDRVVQQPEQDGDRTGYFICFGS